MVDCHWQITCDPCVLRRLLRGIYSARIYVELALGLRSSGLRTILERWIYFISSVKACVIRRGHGLLANENPASTLPGQQSFKMRAKVSVNVGVLWERLYSASARSLRRRSVLVTERAHPMRTQNCLHITA